MMDDPEGKKDEELKIYFKSEGGDEFVVLGNLTLTPLSPTVREAMQRCGVTIQVRHNSCVSYRVKDVRLPVLGGIDNYQGEFVVVAVREEARYAAQDRTGDWWVYSDKPIKLVEDGVWGAAEDGVFADFVGSGLANEDYWEESLLRIL